MSDGAVPTITVSVPDLMPDTRVRAGVAVYSPPTCLNELIGNTPELYGLVTGLDHRGAEWLRWVAEQPHGPRGLLVLALYAGCPTWDHVLNDVLEVQQATGERLRFRVIVRRSGPDRPANLLWLRSNEKDPGTAIIGNVANFLVDVTWEPTDAIMAVPLTTSGSEAVRRWMDWIEQHSKPLTTRTAAAPRLVPPAGTEEGRRQWDAYFDLLNSDGAGVHDGPVVEVDPQTGEVSAKDKDGNPLQTLTSSGVLRPVDPVFEAVQKVLAAGRLVSIDRVGRPPPFDAPLSPEVFGQRGDDRIGALRRRQQFTISLFDDKTRKALDNRRNEAPDVLRRFSLMLQENQRWMPTAAFSLFEKELDEVAKRGMSVLAAATNNTTPEDFVKEQREKIKANCQEMLAQIGRGSPPDKALLDKVLVNLQGRLSANIQGGMRPKLAMGIFQLVESDREGLRPWGTIQTFLVGAARTVREALVDPFRLQGLAVDRKAFVQAFDIFSDPLVERFVDGGSYEDQAKQQLETIDQIEANVEATPWGRSNALWQLMRGECKASVFEVLGAKEMPAK
jgi:hypothetical protein